MRRFERHELRHQWRGRRTVGRRRSGWDGDRWRGRQRYHRRWRVQRVRRLAPLSGAISLYADASATAQAYWSSGVLGNGEVNKIPLTSLRVLKLGTTFDDNN